MGATIELERIANFRAAFARRQAAAVMEVPGGVAVLDDQYAASHVNNELVIEGTKAPAPADLLTLADSVLGHLPYRRITFLDDATGQAGAPELVAAGYVHETELLMSYDSATVDAAAAVATAAAAAAATPDLTVQAVTLDELRPALLLQQRFWMPDAEEAVVEQLADRRAARLRGAPEVSFLAVRDEHGVIACSADLYFDPEHDIAQFEDLVTADTHLRRGYADAVLATAIRRAAGCGLFFLIADSDDWPRTWYARRGFTAIGQSHVFTRLPEA